ncbi:MAG: DUF5662 family protein [Hydrogeniiclostridium mannosilyticum]
MVQRDILNDRLRLLYDDGTQGVLEAWEAVSLFRACHHQTERLVGLTLKQAKLKLGIKELKSAARELPIRFILQKHSANVKKCGFDWLQTNMPWLFEGKPDAAWQQTEFATMRPNQSRMSTRPMTLISMEATAHAVVQAFQRAWLLHIHRNPHHWQHWVLINDDPGKAKSCWDALQLYY